MPSFFPRAAVLTTAFLIFAGCDDPTGGNARDASYHLRIVAAGQLALLLYHNSDPGLPIAELNNKGEVVFTARGGPAYLWTGGNLIPLGQGVAMDINDSGQIVGSMGSPRNAVVWSSDRSPETAYSEASKHTLGISIDEDGAIIVSTQRVDGIGCGAGGNCTYQILRVSGQTVTRIGGGNLRAAAANGFGSTVGWHQLNSSTFRPFVIHNSTYFQLATGIAGYHGFAFDLNDIGQIVGMAGTGGHFFRGHVPVLWDAAEAAPTFLSGTTAGAAFGINEAGDVVGYIASEDLPGSEAVLWKGVEIVILDETLDVEGWQLLGAADINDRGEILAWGTDPSGQPTVVLLEPTI